MHRCVSRLTTIGSDNGLSPCRRQAIIWTSVGILLFGPLGTNFSEILIIYLHSIKCIWKCRLEIGGQFFGQLNWFQWMFSLIYTMTLMGIPTYTSLLLATSLFWYRRKTMHETGVKRMDSKWAWHVIIWLLPWAYCIKYHLNREISKCAMTFKSVTSAIFVQMQHINTIRSSQVQHFILVQILGNFDHFWWYFNALPVAGVTGSNYRFPCQTGFNQYSFIESVYSSQTLKVTNWELSSMTKWVCGQGPFY